MVEKKFYVWIEPAERLITVSADLYQKLVDMKIWDHPDKLVQLGSKNRPLKVSEIDPFPDNDKYFRHIAKLDF